MILVIAFGASVLHGKRTHSDGSKWWLGGKGFCCCCFVKKKKLKIIIIIKFPEISDNLHLEHTGLGDDFNSEENFQNFYKALLKGENFD